MNRTQRSGATEQTRSTDVDPLVIARSTSVHRNLTLLRRSVKDTSHTIDSIASATGKHRSFVDQVLKGDKPLRLEFEVMLPADLLALFRQRQAEDCGLIAVAPLPSRDEAMRLLVSGLVGVLTHSLPAKADRMAKASVTGPEKVAVNQ
jgi:hypothetical protein